VGSSPAPGTKFPKFPIMDNIFEFSSWENGQEWQTDSTPEGLTIPPPVDKYHPGHLKWGADPKRGRGLQASRLKKRSAANTAFFHETVFPILEPHLLPGDYKNFAMQFADVEFYKKGGFVKVSSGERYQWIHPLEEKDLMEKAKSLNYTIEVF
jgi:hypothetical protein